MIHWNVCHKAGHIELKKYELLLPVATSPGTYACLFDFLFHQKKTYDYTAPVM